MSNSLLLVEFCIFVAERYLREKFFDVCLDEYIINVMTVLLWFHKVCDGCKAVLPVAHRIAQYVKITTSNTSRLSKVSTSATLQVNRI